MNFFIRKQIIFAWTIICSCSINNPDELRTGGPGTGTGVGTVAGTFYLDADYRQGGSKKVRAISAAAGAFVTMRPFNYRPEMIDFDTLFTDTADEQGGFMFDSIPEGRYTIVGISSDLKYCAIIDSVVADSVSSGDAAILVDTLKSPGVLKGVVSLGETPETGLVVVLGTDYSSTVDSNGAYSLDGLPEGNLRVQFITNATGYSSDNVRSLWIAGGTDSTLDTLYGIIYSGNGNDTGRVPLDGGRYFKNESAPVMDNIGGLYRNGYAFMGWNTDADGNGKSYGQGSMLLMPNANVTLYAQWTTGATVTLNYDGNGNTGGATPVVSNHFPHSTAVVTGNHGNLVKDGSIFAGWNTRKDGAGIGYNSGDTLNIGSEDLTLYAWWTDRSTFTIIYSGNGNAGGQVPVDKNTYQIGMAAHVAANIGKLFKTGYAFSGWNTQPDGNGDAYLPGAYISFANGPANQTLFAQWKPNTLFRVTYFCYGNSGGTVPVDTIRYEEGDTAIVLGNTGNLVSPVLTFIGWNTDLNGSGRGYLAYDVLLVDSSNVKLFAQWTGKPTYRVVYAGNGNAVGAAPVDENNYLEGARVTVLGNAGNLAKPDAVFKGWGSQPDGGVYYEAGQTFSKRAFTDTLYAIWSSVYAIIYDGNGNTGGSVPADGKRYEAGDTVTVLGNTGNLVKPQYAFSGWGFTPSAGAVLLPSGNTFTIDSTRRVLYAQWELIPTFSVVYDGNGSTGGNVPIDSTRHQAGASVTVLENTGNLVRQNYVFAGWNSRSDGTGVNFTVGSSFFKASKDETLYAKWDSTYAVTYVGNGNTGGLAPNDANRYPAGATVMVLDNTGGLSRDGSVFIGWSNGSGVHYAPGGTFKIGNQNLVLSAEWTIIPDCNESTDSIQTRVNHHGVTNLLQTDTIKAGDSLHVAMLVNGLGNPLETNALLILSGPAYLEIVANNSWVVLSTPGLYTLTGRCKAWIDIATVLVQPR